MINKAIEKMQNEAEKIGTPIVKMMAQQVTDHITTEARAEAVLQDEKTLDGLKKSFDKFAQSVKKGNQSVIGPEDAEKLIFEYFDFKNEESPKLQKEKTEIIDILDFL